MYCEINECVGMEQPDLCDVIYDHLSSININFEMVAELLNSIDPCKACWSDNFKNCCNEIAIPLIIIFHNFMYSMWNVSTNF